jgi:uncharacterized membrane protein (UPF0127 family)
MKSVLLALGMSLLLVGCNPSPDATTTAEPKTESASKPETATKPPESPEPAPAVPGAGVNPSRAYQVGDLDKRTVTIGGKPIELWIMDSDGKREEGMMFLTDKEVRNDQGMLFVFPAPVTDTKHGFWMRNTVLPLDIIFIAPDQKVLNIQKGKPFDETSLPPAATFQYVIELKQGQANALGVKPGMKIALPTDVKADD